MKREKRTAAVLLLAATAVMPAPSAQAPDGPRLLVIIAVDQMRHDYVDRMAARWTRGLKRLVTDGAVFERNFYPYLQTVTCAGHATIGTGAFPATHGIILNAWWRGTSTASCTDDATVSNVAYAPGGEAVSHSGGMLAVQTMGDRLRERSPESRVVTVSIKPRSAIMLAGRGGSITWRDDKNVWATSTAFAQAPDKDVQAFLDAHPLLALREAVWDRMAPAAAYAGDDAAPGESAPTGWTTTFPHPLAGAPGTSPGQFDTLWETSPYADDYLGAMAGHLVRSKRLGQGRAVDYLGVSFSALDYVGHRFGPDSQEVQDTLLRLDRTIGDLLDVLDTVVGPDRYIVGLSADHGVAPVPERRRLEGASGGRVVLAEVGRVAEAALAQALGPGPHVADVEYTQIYLTETTRQRVAGHPERLQPALDALKTIPGVMRALASEGLEHQRQSSDPVVRAAALSHFPGRSGQIVVVPQPYYVMSTATARGTTHGTLHAYDQHVPLIFFGRGIRPGRYQTASSPADLAPTLAATVGLTLPDADGQVLRGALRIRRN